MNCPFCPNTQKLPMLKNNPVVEHLLILKFENNHIHIHGPIDNKEQIKEFILTIAKEAEIEIENNDSSMCPPSSLPN